MLTDTDLIRKLDFFEPLDAKIIKSIASLCIVREFAAGDAIVRQGEAGLGLYFITGGRAKVEVDREGLKVVVAELKAGDFLGEFALIDEKTRSASVICLENTRCLLLTRDTFAKLLVKHPEIGNQMLRTLVGRIRNTNDRLTTTPSQVQSRVAASQTSSASDTATPETGGGDMMRGISTATEQISAYVPQPEEMMRFYFSSKNKTQRLLNRFVGAIYAMKAMLRFSMAIVGCPVKVSAERPSEEMMEADCNGVKLLLFPAGSDQTIRIEAIGNGAVAASLYRPRGKCVEVLRLAGPIQANDLLRLRLKHGEPMALDSSRANQPHISKLAYDSSLAVNDHWQVSEARWR